MGYVRLLRDTCVSSLALTAALVTTDPAWARNLDQEVEALRDEVAELRRRNTDMERRLGEALRRLDALGAAEGEAEPASPLDRAVRGIETETPSVPARAPTPTATGPLSRVRLLDVSLVTDIAAGLSSERDEEIERLEFGEHDPRQRGFTLQQVELSLAAAVDPYFRSEAYLIYFIDAEGESRFEVEEATLTTQALPYGLQLEVGQMFTEFGRINPMHPHSWHWQDQPVILSRLFGGDGMRGVGTRLGWLTDLPWYSEVHVGVQNADGETMVSFLANDEVLPVGGRTFVERDVSRLDDLVYLARWYNAFDLTDAISAGLGLSGAFGPNATGDDGSTRIYGADLVVKWRPVDQRRGWPFFVFESEVMRRDYEAEDEPAPGLPSDTLRDWGFYAQGLWGFRPRWAAGLRVEHATGRGASVGGRESDFLRDDRFRLSPLIAFYPSEYSRIRLQYNYDRADHLERRDSAHSLWLGFEIGIGAHPAHAF